MRSACKAISSSWVINIIVCFKVLLKYLKISIISLEVAMIYQFGDNDITFRNTMIGITGFAVALINSTMAIYMIIKSKRKKTTKLQISNEKG